MSLALNAHRSSPVPKTGSGQTTPNEHLDISKWTETALLSQKFRSAEFASRYGSIVAVLPSLLYLAIGTDKGYIVGFNYRQEVEFVLSTGQQNGPESPHVVLAVTCVGFSADNGFVGAGFANGAIVLWDLSSVKAKMAVGTLEPFHVISPISVDTRLAEKDGHLQLVAVSSLSFLGHSHTQLVTADVSGLVFYHYGFRKFLKQYVVTQKLLGGPDSGASGAAFSPLDCSLLPLGSSHQITDQLGLLAVISANVLAVVSVLSLNNPHNMRPVTHFKIKRPRGVQKTASGCLSWHPCTVNGNQVDNATLAYAWGSMLAVLELDNASLPGNLMLVLADLKDKDKSIPTLPISKTCRWNAASSETIVAVKWLSHDMLVVFLRGVSGTRMEALYHSEINGEWTLSPVGADSLNGINLSPQAFAENDNLASFAAPFLSYNNCISVLKSRIILLAEDESKAVFLGRITTWADQLAAFLNDGNYPAALTAANDFYNSTKTGQLVLAGLPDNMQQRNEVVRPFLVRIMKELVPHLFSNEDASQNYFLNIYIGIMAFLTKDSAGLLDELLGILEAVFDLYGSKNAFFATLESYILTGGISSLPPTILKELVAHYVATDKGPTLTEIICLLDTTTLDIDLTLQLCTKYRLRECSDYIWNYLLNDYATPLMEYIKGIRDGDEISTFSVFSYLSYVLTGRQYPTDKYIDSGTETHARNSICDILFSISSIRWPHKDSDYVFVGDSESFFPYLHFLLKFSSFEMLSTLNEFFENPALNDDPSRKLNRQYIVEALLDIFDTHRDEFDKGDFCQLAIFLARNYPKYSQFIRLPESVLDSIVDDLYSNTDTTILADCELALQSLLPLYEPKDDALLLEKVKAAQFYDVLLNIYRSENRHSKVLETWLERKKRDYPGGSESLKEAFENAFELTTSVSERMQLVSVIKANFGLFLDVDTEEFAAAIDKYLPSLHGEVLLIEDRMAKYHYLDIFFRLKDHTEAPFLEQAVWSYIELLCDFDIGKLGPFLGQYVEVLARNGADFEAARTLFRSRELYPSLTALFIYEHRPLEALREILVFLKKTVSSMVNEGMFDALEGPFLAHVDLCMATCEHPDTLVAFEDLQLNEFMWLELVDTLVVLSGKAGENERVVDLVNKSIHDCFRRVIDAPGPQNGTKKRSFLVVFHRFLENSSSTSPATVSNIRHVLQDVFVSYTHESEMLQISLRMLNDGIRESMDSVKTAKLEAWNIKETRCTSCGKIMWGPGLSDDHYRAWEDRERGTLVVLGLLEGNFEPERWRHCTLVFFKCLHGYHAGCLEGLGVKEVKECVICVEG